jgi:Restriction endonuclease/HB1, ASXL, restriction endonuclease HTH domain
MSDQTTKPMTYTDAAERVLRESGDKKSMHYQKIVDIAIDNRWLSPQGLTPGATLAASIGLENRRREARGEIARFFVEGRGFYGLTEWQQNTPEIKEAEQQSQQLEDQLITRLHQMPPYRFEEFIGRLLTAMDFIKVQLKGGGGDKGIDIEAELKIQEFGTVKTIVQVKRYTPNTKIGPGIVRNLIGAFTKGSEATYGLLITTAQFGKAAKEAAQQSMVKVWLVDGAELARLMIQNNIGVKERPIKELDEQFFSTPSTGEPPAEGQGTDLPGEITPETAQESKSKRARSGKVQIPKGLKLYAKSGSQTFEAVVGEGGTIVYNGHVYGSPSGAARGATDTSRDGWIFWWYQDPETGEPTLLDELRHKQTQE